MADEWTFPTTSGTATVTSGELRVSGSLSQMASERWREGWTRNGAGRRLLFLVSVVGSVAFLARAVESVEAMVSGSTDVGSLVVLALVGFVVLAVSRRAARTRTIRLREIQAVRLVDHDRLQIEYEGTHDTLDVETPTEADADEAVEMLRLRGVPVERAVDSDASVSSGFRRRLRAKGE